MLLDMTSILCGDRDAIEFDYDLLPTEQSLSDGQNDLSSFEQSDIVFTKPARISGKVENMAGYMRIKVDALISYRTHCARCLKDIEGTFPLHFERSVAQSLENSENDDYIIITDGKLDVDSAVYEEIFLEFPTKFLCSDNCKGFCQKCGKNLNDGACACKGKEVDPRLAVLLDLLDK